MLSIDNKRELGLVEILSTSTRNVIQSEPVGSRVTCNPPPTDTDMDVLVLVRDMKKFVDDAVVAGFEVGGSFICKDDFTSLTRGEINLIVTQDGEFYRRFWCASRLAKRWNLLFKEDRIRLFQAVLYGNG